MSSPELHALLLGEKVEEIYLGIGEWYFTTRPTRIRTLLGSCISVTMWHPRLRIGGMCHYMLPERQSPVADAPLDGRYADEAMIMFDQAFIRHGTRPNDYVAKVFGGGNMFATQDKHKRQGMDIGQRNIETVHRLLAQRRIPIVAEHLGGEGHRRLIFDVHNGDAWIAFHGNGITSQAMAGTS